MRGIPVAEVEFHVFSSVHPISAGMESEAFSEGYLGFKKILPFLNRGVRAVGKEALLAGINVIEDVENNKPLKEAIKSRLVESRGNLKRKAKEKISSLMRGSGYKISTKSAALQFPLGGRDRNIAHRKRRRGVKRKSSRSITGRKSKKVRKKKIRCWKKNQKIIR